MCIRCPRQASQALAYRDATTEDEEVIVRIINAAYAPEVSGQEAFRVGPGTVTRGEVQALLACPAHQWLLLELPRGRNIETDGTVLGVCCYTTDGVCRKNGSCHMYMWV